MIAVIVILGTAYIAACFYLPVARALEMCGGTRGAWLRLPVKWRLRSARLIKYFR